MKIFQVNNQYLIDIIIVNYNSTDHTLRSLKTIFGLDKRLPVNVFVEDNGSKDRPERIRSEYPQTILTINRKNLGFAKAVNRAFLKGRAPYVLLLNPDTMITNAFFGPILNYMSNNPQVAVVGPKVLNEDGTVQGSARTFPTLLTGLFGRRSLFSQLFPNNRFTRGNIVNVSRNGKTVKEVDWVSGACILIRRKAIEDVGGMDERFFMYWEDADLCRRMWRKGWKVVYFPSSTIVHFVGASSNTLPIRSTIEFHKSSYRLYKKYTKWPFLRATAAVMLTIRCILICYSHIFKGLVKKISGFFKKVENEI